MKLVEILLAVIQSIPHPDAITSLELDFGSDCIYFTWRKEELKISNNGEIYVIDNVDCGHKNNVAILLERLILTQIYKNLGETKWQIQKYLMKI